MESINNFIGNPDKTVDAVDSIPDIRFQEAYCPRKRSAVRFSYQLTRLKRNIIVECHHGSGSDPVATGTRYKFYRHEQLAVKSVSNFASLSLFNKQMDFFSIF
jgi:hypothetical protein